MTLEELKELIAHNRGIIKDCQRRIRVLEQQEAKWGLNVPTNILVEMEEAREKMQECENEIEQQRQAYINQCQNEVAPYYILKPAISNRDAFSFLYKYLFCLPVNGILEEAKRDILSSDDVDETFYAAMAVIDRLSGISLSYSKSNRIDVMAKIVMDTITHYESIIQEAQQL